MTNLDWPRAKDEIAAAATWLKTTGSPKVGAIGFCMGGALTLIAAQHADDVAAAAPFYGTPDAGICQARSFNTSPHTTPFAWWTPILKDFARRISPPTPRFQSPPSTPFNFN
jgi:dienelactone hydrolase